MPWGSFSEFAKSKSYKNLKSQGVGNNKLHQFYRIWMNVWKKTGSEKEAFKQARGKINQG